ncbi:MAG: dockerin type I domain-containing protein [Planctomycetota bacterium]
MTQQRIRMLMLAAAALGAPVILAVAGGPTYDLTWRTIDGGGVMRSTGGDFELSGTIGQPDAGAMSGGNFTLTGGFWFEVIPSDCNEDGVVNLFDYDTFQTCLTGPGGGPLPAGCNCYDFDGDGKITLLDFATVQAMFNGQ